jgi:hypothetical protein
MTDELEVSGMGWKAKLSGRQSLLFGLLLVCVMGSAWSFYKHREEVHEEHAQLRELLSEAVYVLSLKPEEREKLRLDMPDTLRSKMRRKRDDP